MSIIEFNKLKTQNNSYKFIDENTTIIIVSEISKKIGNFIKIF